MVMSFQNLAIKTVLSNLTDAVMVSLDLLGGLRLAGPDQALRAELIQLSVSAAADLGGPLGDVGVERLSRDRDYFEQAPGRCRKTRKSRANQLV
jgi:hypothetical protein